jgi:hypothetical protein
LTFTSVLLNVDDSIVVTTTDNFAATGACSAKSENPSPADQGGRLAIGWTADL